MIAQRRQMRELYKAMFGDVNGVEVFGAEGDEHDNVWLTSIVVDPAATGWEPAELSAALAAKNIESRPLWKPMHLQPVLARSRGEINGVSEDLFTRGLTLPSGSALTLAQRTRVLTAIAWFLEIKAPHHHVTPTALTPAGSGSY